VTTTAVSDAVRGGVGWGGEEGGTDRHPETQRETETHRKEVARAGPEGGRAARNPQMGTHGGWSTRWRACAAWPSPPTASSTASASPLARYRQPLPKGGTGGGARVWAGVRREGCGKTNKGGGGRGVEKQMCVCGGGGGTHARADAKKVLASSESGGPGVLHAKGRRAAHEGVLHAKACCARRGKGRVRTRGLRVPCGVNYKRGYKRKHGYKRAVSSRKKRAGCKGAVCSRVSSRSSFVGLNCQ
jgi:hypothetical protein